ncbi:hypothetical protein QBC33DRAFT_215051 [Phialemonium atrogriseum]|uniref:C2H2-type domain-containing protein n=1 Tax=Phialemonium atrogriseum TaxID=1093897 RepID=A0AAJ0FS27_9PEZI|nr:uncharacterized protein QBC33DRAFT_215051 [Phialemonium atrogriseum]KAK1770745.1 hypothetical protein QBC33DRAFT_215051 [Phialemonium atrogriseum]
MDPYQGAYSSPMSEGNPYQDMPDTPLYPMSPTFDSGGGSSDGRQYVCLAAGCEHVPFKRVTDLDRHYKSVHTRDEDKDKFFCDYKKCPRSQDPFYRPERLRNHLRDYHKEDLPKKGTKASAEWLKERNVQPKWWRCYSCLKRVEIRREGFTCPTCNQVCEPDRQSLREKRKR